MAAAGNSEGVGAAVRSDGWAGQGGGGEGRGRHCGAAVGDGREAALSDCSSRREGGRQRCRNAVQDGKEGGREGSSAVGVFCLVACIVAPQGLPARHLLVHADGMRCGNWLAGAC